MTQPVVLVVDDSLTVRMDLSEAFRAAGFQAIACSNAAEARSALAAEPISAIVLDVILPDGDGIEILRELRSNTATGKLPVLLLSTEAEVRDRIRGLETGADDYVGKPYDIHYVVSRARELLRMRTEPPPVASSTVLVIDDSLTYRSHLEEALTRSGYNVVSAVSGEEGLRLAANRRPDAFVIDGVLPGMDGASVIRRIRLDAALRRIPCLALTGSEDEGAEIRALDAGADTFARKEEDLSVVVARLTTILRSASAGTPGGPASLLAPKKILAVDDSKTYLNTLAEALRNSGYDVILAQSGEEALEMLAAQPVDCIVLDLLMPGIGGKETCRRIKQATGLRDTPLIILTGMDDSNAMIEGLGAGADDYIAKSSEFEVLKARIRAQIRRRQFEEETRIIRDRLLHVELEAAEERAARAVAEARAELVGELEWKNRELEAFSYSVSHDLRAPLRAIDGFSVALLEDYRDVLDARAQDYLRRVCSAAHRMSELIDDLLELSRVGRSVMKVERIDLTAIAHQVAEGLQRGNPERNVRFVVQDGLAAHADLRLIRLVFENLLGNAWKFTAPVAEAVIGIGVDRSGGREVYFVEDNGAGFDMAHSQKLFSPFQRLHSPQEFAGTGIGLATVQRVIHRHGGRVWAEGEVNRGAKISWTLPDARKSRSPQ
jgi:two-component system, NtrC family, sensor kinase